MKEDRYEFPASEWMFAVKEEEPKSYILYRKKPRVKVEWRAKDLNSALGRNETAHFEDYGCYRIVQFRVTGCVAEVFVKLPPICGEIDLCQQTEFKGKPCDTGYSKISIGKDARDKWSAPVLLPESVYNRLDEITKALEDRANDVEALT